MSDTKSLECKCAIIHSHADDGRRVMDIEYCPLHQSAPELFAKAALLDEAVAALEAFDEAWEQRPIGGVTECGHWVEALTKARTALAKVREKGG